MAKAKEGDVVQTDKAQREARLQELEHKVGTTLAELAAAVVEIHRDELYCEAGYDSFAAYCRDRLQYQKSRAYQVLSAGQVFPLLDSTTVDSIRCERLFRPIQGMKIENQAKCLTLAVKVANQSGLRLTEKVVEDVAEKNFHWLPKSKREQQRKGQQNDDPEAASKERRETLLLCIEGIVGMGLTGAQMVQEFGNAYEWPGFMELRTIVSDAMDASE